MSAVVHDRMSTTPMHSRVEAHSHERSNDHDHEYDPQSRAEFEGTFLWSAFEPDRHRSISIAVAETLAAVEGVDVTDLEVVLAESIDPDALDDLFARHAGGDGDRWQLEFVAGGHAVCVRSDGAILVES